LKDAESILNTAVREDEFSIFFYRKVRPHINKES